MFGNTLQQNEQFMWKLRINKKTDDKLVGNFPNDPYSDLTILTTNQQLHLSLAYLSIDSNYFEELSPATQLVNLKDLPEEPLLLVIRSLYGARLETSSVTQLEGMLKVIDFLDIQEYRQNIIRQLMGLHEADPTHSPLFSIQMLEFCLKNNLIKEYICQLHYNQKLQALESSKNYLQLGKLSKPHLNQLLLNYLATAGSPAAKTINTILENYFNRKGLRAAQELQEEGLVPLREIWEDFHHTLSAKTIKTFTKTRASIVLMENISESRHSRFKLQKLITLPSIKFDGTSSSTLQSEKTSEEELLDFKLELLEKQREEKENTIETLKKELQALLYKREERVGEEPTQLEDITLFQNIIRSRKSKEQKYSGENSLSYTSERAFELHRPLNRDGSTFSFSRTPCFRSRQQLP